jgi:nitroreductase
LQQRESDYRAATFTHHEIDRDDEQARRNHRRRNFQFFDAPVELIFHLPRNAEAGNFLDMGCFMQNVILGLVAHGLGNCPQFSVASYSAIVHEHLQWSEKRTIVAGMAVGYYDPEH